MMRASMAVAALVASGRLDDRTAATIFRAMTKSRRERPNVYWTANGTTTKRSRQHTAKDRQRKAARKAARK